MNKKWTFIPVTVCFFALVTLFAFNMPFSETCVWGEETETATEMKTEAVAETATEMKTEAVTETATEMKTEAVAETATEIETEAVAETATEMKTEAVTETVPEPEVKPESTEMKTEESSIPDGEKPLAVMDLFWQGGVLMYPITFFSFLVVAVGLERFWGLRRGAVLPRRLIHNLDVQISAKADPRAIYALCKKNRSAVSRVIQAALFKSGRPMNEVLETIQNAKDNEANRLYGRVRLLNLAAAVSPLLGLLGTVIGMIQAFMATASSVGIHKAEMLSEGIYLALITTCAGLVVAIPAAILAHWYEGKIQKLFYQMDLRLVNFVAYMERLEGKVHFMPSAFRSYMKQKP